VSHVPDVTSFKVQNEIDRTVLWLQRPSYQMK
jgi:hypothetical protein